MPHPSYSPTGRGHPSSQWRRCRPFSGSCSSCSYLSPSRPDSDALDQGGDTHTATNAQGDNGAACVAAFQFVDDGANEHRARRAEGVTHGDGAAVHVELLVGDAEVALELEHDRRERLVDLEEVDVGGREPCDR